MIDGDERKKKNKTDSKSIYGRNTPNFAPFVLALPNLFIDTKVV